MDLTVFSKIDFNDVADKYGKILEEKRKLHPYFFESLDEFGYETFCNPKTGKKMACRVFVGPCFYTRVQRYVVDSIYAISKGSVNVESKQPIASKKNFGGLKLSEMEMLTFSSHGSLLSLAQKFHKDSDDFTTFLCINCGQLAQVCVEQNYVKCIQCEGKAEIVKIPSTWTSNMLIHRIENMNIGINFSAKPKTIYKNLEDKSN